MHDDRSFDGNGQRGGFRWLARLPRDIRDAVLDGVDASTVVGRLSILYRSVAMILGLALCVPFSIAAIHWLVVNYATNAYEQIFVDAALGLVVPACAAAVVARYRAPIFGMVARLRTWAESFGTVRRR